MQYYIYVNRQIFVNQRKTCLYYDCVFQRDLHTMEREMYQAKRARDQKLNDMKKDVEKRKELADRTEKKVGLHSVQL